MCFDGEHFGGDGGVCGRGAGAAVDRVYSGGEDCVGQAVAVRWDYGGADGCSCGTDFDGCVKLVK